MIQGLNEYQTAAIKTAIYAGRGTIIGKMYVALKMNGEAGEVAEQARGVLGGSGDDR